MFRIERADGSRFTIWTLALLLLIPVLVAGGLIAVARPSTSKVSAAIVNLDQAITLNGQIVPLGRQLAAAMVDQKENITWTLADLPLGEQGLKNGEYAVLVVIPRTFSEAATSYSANKAEQAKQATIDIRVGQNSPVTDAEVAQHIARVAAEVLNKTLTEAYLDQIYLGFNTMGKQFTDMVGGARQLADGARKLDEGLGEAAAGAAQLADGMGQFTDGTRELAAGIQRMNSEGGPLFEGIGQLADGTKGVVGGVGQLADGLRRFEREVRTNKQDYSELQKLKVGAAQVAAGAKGLSGGVNQISDMLKLLTVAKLPTPGTSQPVKCPVDDPETCRIFMQVMASLQKLANGQITIPPELFDQLKCPVDDPVQCETFNEVVGLIRELASGSHKIPQEIIDGFKCPANDPDMCVLLLRTYLAGFQTGTGVGWVALNAPDPASKLSLKQGASQLAGGARQLSDGVAQFVDELPKQAALQQSQLAGGIAQAAAGAEELVTKAQPLIDGANQAATGARQFKVGLSTLAGKVGALPAGAKRLHEGMLGLASGMNEAQGGSSKLSTGLDTFATALKAGQSQVPYYSAEDRATLKKVVSRPILSDTSLLSSHPATLLAVLLSAALWVAALATYLVVRPVPSRVLTSSRATWQLAGAALAPGMAIAATQAVLMGIVGALLLKLGFGTAVALCLVLAIAGAAFVAVNHAAAACFGGWGRAVFLGLAMLSVAAGLTSGAPAVVSWLGQLSPVAPAIQAIRSLAAGASLTEPVGTLLLWLVVGVAVGLVVIAKSRQLSPAQFRRSRPDAQPAGG